MRQFLLFHWAGFDITYRLTYVSRIPIRHTRHTIRGAYCIGSERTNKEEISTDWPDSAPMKKAAIEPLRGFTNGYYWNVFTITGDTFNEINEVLDQAP